MQGTESELRIMIDALNIIHHDGQVVQHLGSRWHVYYDVAPSDRVNFYLSDEELVEYAQEIKHAWGASCLKHI